MAPGPKKKGFQTQRNAKNYQNSITNEKKNSESPEPNKTTDSNHGLIIDSDVTDSKKYSKRSIQNNWVKYEEPPTDPHADSTRGKEFDVLLSYSGGAGSQVKLQDEKDWEDESLNLKEITLNFQDLVGSMKCIPFHKRINVENVFDDKHIMHFESCAGKWKECYKLQSESQISEPKDVEVPSVDLDLNIVEEHDSFESDDIILVKNFTVQDKTENIINALASNLTFKELPEKEEAIPVEEKKPEAVSNDLDFLLSLNISSKVSANVESAEVSKTSNVDDWLDSILDD